VAEIRKRNMNEIIVICMHGLWIVHYDFALSC